MTPDNFAYLSRLLHRRAGHVLSPARMAQVETRLAPVMRRFNFRDLDALLRDLRLGHEPLAAAVTEALMVGETSFFRDTALFDTLRHDVLPRRLAARSASKRLRIWSAACATGQEAYCIAMVLDSMGLAARGWMIDLIATDLSDAAIARAQDGRYSFFEAQRGLSRDDLATWFRESDGGYRVVAPLRRMVTFRQFNLLDSYGWLDDLDIVFCRNVLMYFDPATKASVLERIADTMAPDGLLALGDTETPSPGLFDAVPGAERFFSRSVTSQRLAAAR